MSEESTPFAKDVAGKRTPDVGDVQPALRVCPAKRPLSDGEAVDFCAADVDDEANFTGPVIVSPADEQNAGIDIAKHTQASLVKACKRHRLSTSGAKSALLSRLNGTGMASDEALRAASDQWDLLQEPAERGSEVKKRRDPNWSMHETARLCHVVADPRNATALRKLYQRETNRAELDSGMHDPWSNDIWIFLPIPTSTPMFRKFKAELCSS
jgi:hypothetical protein